MSERVRSEPAEIVLKAAVEKLRELGLPLREQGWDANVMVRFAEADEDHYAVVSLDVKIWTGRVPIEARVDRSV